MHIIIGADFVPTESNSKQFIDGNSKSLFDNDIVEILKNADFRIFNLEVPLTDNKDKIDKCGPGLIAPTACVNLYKSVGVNLLALANNHILDQNIQGLQSTISVLNEYEIQHIGAGKNIEEAKKAYIIHDIDKNIGIYACAEHEFSIVDINRPGANPYDSITTIHDIAELKEQCNSVIVLYHGGKEHYRYPSPLLQKRLRLISEAGANLIIAQHTHCIGCEEKYKDATIVYGQGNFLFDHQNNEYWNTSLLIDYDTESCFANYIPLIKNGEGLAMAQGQTALEIINNFNERSSEIKLPGFIEEKYNEFALKNINNYLLTASGLKGSLMYRIVNRIKRGKYIRARYDKTKLLEMQNFLECEAHNELWLAGIKALIKDLEK